MSPKTTSRQKPLKNANSEPLKITAWCRWANLNPGSSTAIRRRLADMGHLGPTYPQSLELADKVKTLLAIDDKGGHGRDRAGERHNGEDMAGLKLRKLRAETHKVEQALTASRSDLLRRYREEVLLAILSGEYAPICAECRKWIPPNQRRAFNAIVDQCDKSLSIAMEVKTAEWLRSLEIEP